MAIEEYGKAHEEWLTKVLGLQNGILSHDTLGDVFAVVDTEQFSQCFSRWVADIASLTEQDVIATDGKCLRASLNKSGYKAAIYMVSAWSHHHSMVLGQEKVANKSNEITAIPQYYAINTRLRKY